MTYPAPSCAQWAWMDTLQNQMLRAVDTGAFLLCRATPGQKDHTTRSLLGDKINDLLSETFPTLAGMTKGFMSPNSQTCVQKQDTTICPRSKESTFVWRRLKSGVVFLESDIDVLQRRGRWRWRTDGEAETMRLVVVVVWVLAENDSLDGGEGCVSGP